MGRHRRGVVHALEDAEVEDEELDLVAGSDSDSDEEEESGDDEEDDDDDDDDDDDEEEGSDNEDDEDDEDDSDEEEEEEQDDKGGMARSSLAAAAVSTATTGGGANRTPAKAKSQEEAKTVERSESPPMPPPREKVPFNKLLGFEIGEEDFNSTVDSNFTSVWDTPLKTGKLGDTTGTLGADVDGDEDDDLSGQISAETLKERLRQLRFRREEEVATLRQTVDGVRREMADNTSTLQERLGAIEAECLAYRNERDTALTAKRHILKERERLIDEVRELQWAHATDSKEHEDEVEAMRDAQALKDGKIAE